MRTSEPFCFILLGIAKKANALSRLLPKHPAVFPFRAVKGPSSLFNPGTEIHNCRRAGYAKPSSCGIQTPRSSGGRSHAPAPAAPAPAPYRQNHRRGYARHPPPSAAPRKGKAPVPDCARRNRRGKCFADERKRTPRKRASPPARRQAFPAGAQRPCGGPAHFPQKSALPAE